MTPEATAAEREAAAKRALDAHKDTCASCRDVLPCTRLPDLRAAWRAAWRQALREAAASGQITTTPATG